MAPKPTSTNPRVDGYIRVSRVGQRGGERFISPDVQREAIEHWSERLGFELLEVFEELDEPGSRATRPLLGLAVERIELGVATGLAVTRVDRFSRSLADGVNVIERVRAAGGTFYAIEDGLDTSTDAGRMVVHILLSVAEYQLARITAGWDKAREHAIRRGVWVAKVVPVGYRKTRSGRLRPHSTAGPAMTEVFRRRAAGARLVSLCEYLEAEHVLTGFGNAYWNPQSLRETLQRRVYLGEVYAGGYVRADSHPPLTDPATWQTAQQPRLTERSTRRAPALLAGLVRCAACRHMLVPLWIDRHGKRFRCYGCKGRWNSTHRKLKCPAPAYIIAARLEPYVIETVLDLLRRRRGRPCRELDKAQEAARAALLGLARYRDDDRIRRVLGEDAYLAGLGVRAQRLREANLALAKTRSRAAIHDLPSVEEARDVLAAGELESQRELISRVIDVAFVAAGRATPQQRVTICPAGTAPEVPNQGTRPRVIRAIEPQRDWLNAGESCRATP